MLGHIARKHSVTDGENEIRGGKCSAKIEFLGAFVMSSGLNNPDGCLGYKKFGSALLKEIWNNGGIFFMTFSKKLYREIWVGVNPPI